MSETIPAREIEGKWSARTWGRFSSFAAGISCLSFLIGAALFLFPPGNPMHGSAMNGAALVLAGIATLSGGMGIYGFNRYAELHADDSFVALWTNLLCRVLAMVELLSFAAVLAWIIIHFIGIPVFGNFHH